MDQTSATRAQDARITSQSYETHRHGGPVGGVRLHAVASVLTPGNEPARTLAGGLRRAQLQRVVAYIDANLHHGLPLAELSSVVHISPFYFARLFKTSTNVSPHRFVIRRRIEHAMSLLTEAASVDAVARTVGFRSASHFGTTFRRVVGLTPSRYRMLAEAAERGVDGHVPADPPDVTAREP